MPYTYHTDDDRKEMLQRLGVESEDQLFEQIPSAYRIPGPLPLAAGKTEPETMRMFAEIAEKNRPAATMLSFLGGGIYDHFVPALVRHLAGRPEFMTAYTPYQAEVSQGTLQVIFEFQSHISRLTGMPVANASMYDAASALAEATLMTAKITGRGTVLYPAGLNPRYLAVMKRYATGQDISLQPVPFAAGSGQLDTNALRAQLSPDVAGLIVQTPNYFGVLEQPWTYEADVHQAGALLVACVDPISLAVFRQPGAYGADIVVGEGQSLGNDMNFGGPLLGFMACGEPFVRQMPGRIVSATRDVDGREAYVLTLQTREQHIRREKATSNICTNQGLMATRATIYLSLLGETGLVELGRVCCERAHRLAELVGGCPGFALRFDGPFFREFVVRCPKDAEAVVKAARGDGILAGIPLSRYFGDAARRDLLVATTEKHTEADYERFCSVLRKD